MFSENKLNQNHFVNTLLSKGGTLLLSNFSFAEFAAASDPRHCREAEAFLDRLLPNIYLTDFNLEKILAKELKEPNNAKRFWPPADLPELKLFAARAQVDPPLFTLRGFVTRAYTNRAALALSTEGIVRKITDGLESARRDPVYVANARNIPPGDRRPRMLLILGELLRGFNLDPKAPISANDVIDLFHAALPVNSCDYVLLDGPWVERVEKMQRRIAKTSMRMPIAHCFSRRGNGVVKFLADLDAFDKAANATDVACP